jgi:hypothetical protein
MPGARQAHLGSRQVWRGPGGRTRNPVQHFRRTPICVSINGMAYCELCDMDRGSCPHGLAERRAGTVAGTSFRLISPRGMAHFLGCPTKAMTSTSATGATSMCDKLGSAWETASICTPPVACVAISSPPPGARPASITALGEPSDRCACPQLSEHRPTNRPARGRAGGVEFSNVRVRGRPAVRRSRHTAGLAEGLRAKDCLQWHVMTTTSGHSACAPAATRSARPNFKPPVLSST